MTGNITMNNYKSYKNEESFAISFIMFLKSAKQILSKSKNTIICLASENCIGIYVEKYLYPNKQTTTKKKE